MAKQYETAIYTREELENARTKGQLIGWAQGGLAVAALFMLLNFIGWIPLVLIAGVLGFFGYKLATKGKNSSGST